MPLLQTNDKSDMLYNSNNSNNNYNKSK